MLDDLSFFRNPTFLLIKIPGEGNGVRNEISSCSNSALAKNHG
jgi:hypothetical protein